MIWKEYIKDENGEQIYARVDDDGLIRITAVRGYPELDAYLAWVDSGKKPEDFWTQQQGI